MSTSRSSNYPVLPLKDVVVFPHMVIPLFVGRDKSVAAYLFYLGVGMLMSSTESSPLMKKPANTSEGRVYRDLALVTALNPKSNTFFIAFVPQFINAEHAFAPQAAILIATFVTIAGINALVFAIGANSIRNKITRPSVITWLTRAGGLTLIAMAALTATLRRAT